MGATVSPVFLEWVHYHTDLKIGLEEQGSEQHQDVSSSLLDLRLFPRRRVVDVLEISRHLEKLRVQF